jgi:hypothetical protein
MLNKMFIKFGSTSYYVTQITGPYYVLIRHPICIYFIKDGQTHMAKLLLFSKLRAILKKDSKIRIY